MERKIPQTKKISKRKKKEENPFLEFLAVSQNFEVINKDGAKKSDLQSEFALNLRAKQVAGRQETRLASRKPAQLKKKSKNLLPSFKFSLTKITAMCLIVLMNWTWFGAIGDTAAYLNDRENAENNDFLAGNLDFELESDADFTPATLELCGSAERTIDIINYGNLFKYTASSTDFSGELCAYVNLEANVNGGDREYSGPLVDFYFGPDDYEDPESWNFKLTLNPSVPANLNGQTCDFKFLYFGSQIRHELDMGDGFSDREEISSTITASIPQFCTETQGAWGADCQGDNPACLLADNWNTGIGGNLIVGQGYDITLTDTEAVKNYLPDGGTADSLDADYLNPVTTNSGILGGQVTALKINAMYSAAGIGLIGSSMPISNLTIATGTFAGLNVANFLMLAEKALGGDTSALDPYSASLSDVSDTARQINENFDDCVENKGYLIQTDCTYTACGNGIKESNETCDDGNLIFGDGCDANCQSECYIAGVNSSAPILAKLDNGTIVTEKVAKSDDIRAYQSVSGTKYIYLDWKFSGLPSDVPLNLAQLTLEHRENDATMSVQWWNGLVWLDVCDPAESASDLVATCNLIPYLNNTNKAEDVKIRLKLLPAGGCHEELDWAFLEIAYHEEVECNICGNSLVEEDEECDDGNTVSGDGCDAVCQEECAISGSVVSTPTLAKLNGGSIVTDKVKYSDNKYAYQSVSGTKYIYLDWVFADLPSNIPTKQALLSLEHQESDVDITVEWWDGANWLQVCDPLERNSDTIDTCDLLGFLDNTDKIGDVKIRLKLYQDGNCHESLDWAQLEISWHKTIPCVECGNGIIEEEEECDDGNTSDNDGCSANCQTEDPSNCLKINEVYYDPDSCHGDIYDEWIELYNACDFTVNLKDWYFTDNGGEVDKEKITQSYPIEAHAFVVIASNAQTWTYWPLIPDNATKIALGGSRLFKGLGDGGDQVFLYNTNQKLVDSMSYGDNTSAFDPSAIDVLKGHSLSRNPAGADTDTAADWMDTHSGSTPPGPNPGTNPHDADGNLILPGDEANPCCDTGVDTTDNSDEYEINPDLILASEISNDTTEILSATSGSVGDNSIEEPGTEETPTEETLTEETGTETTDETGTGEGLIEESSGTTEETNSDNTEEDNSVPVEESTETSEPTGIPEETVVLPPAESAPEENNPAPTNEAVIEQPPASTPEPVDVPAPAPEPESGGE